MILAISALLNYYAENIGIGFSLLGVGLFQFLFGNWMKYLVENKKGGKFFVFLLHLIVTFLSIMAMIILHLVHVIWYQLHWTFEKENNTIDIYPANDSEI